MKRIGNLYDAICSYENTRKAILNASKNKRGRAAVKEVLAHLDERAAELSEILRSENVTLHPYKTIYKREGTRGKLREIHKPEFWPDQCIHWAIYNVLGPVLWKGMYPVSCGSVPGRGPHLGKRIIRKWLEKDRKHTKYYLKMDVRHFYPSIDNERMKAALRRKIKDKRLLALLDKIIDMDKGQPIGVLLSQVFANVYLAPLDFYIKQTLGAAHYIRYMDDMVIFASSKRALHKMRVKIAEWLQAEGLSLKGNWQVCRLDKEAPDFMGFRFYRDRVTLRRALMLRITRRTRKTDRKGKDALPKNASAVLSYLGWIKHSNSYHLYCDRIRPYLHIQRLKNIVRKEQKKNAGTEIPKHRKTGGMGHDQQRGCCLP